MSFVRKQIDAERGFGVELKELRELRGWSLDQLAHVSGIHKSTIQALEEENLEVFRDPLYVERHLRSIVKALDGRVGFFLHKYQVFLEEKGYLVEKKPLTFFARIKRSALFVPSKYFLLLLPVPLAMVLGFYVWRQASYLAAPPRLEILEPVDHLTLREPFATVSGITDPTALVSVNGTPAVVEASGVYGITINIPRGMTKLVVIAKRRYGGISEATRYVTYEPELAPAVLNTKNLQNATSTQSATSTLF
ncbi:MAG: helix-turn-helix domain-containing protein [Patescibacteria group bacterium]|nr:helix-turn-helix domain-containing protein [Patescibacteria group bacterium]